jgi:hypothetical protein
LPGLAFEQLIDGLGMLEAQSEAALQKGLDSIAF